MTIFSKIKFIFQKPKLVIITGEEKESVKELVTLVLNRYFRIGRDVLIYDLNLGDLEKMKFLINVSAAKVLVADQFNSVKEGSFPGGTLVCRSKKGIKIYSMPSQRESLLEATDIKNSEKVNFKINYEGNLVPVWLDERLKEEKIQAALVAAGVGLTLGLNLVEVSQAFGPQTRDL